MTHLALLWDAGGEMVRIVCALVVLEVAGHASGGREIKISADVALITLQLGMAAGERESNRVVIEVRRLPGAGGMALLASLGKAEGDMVGIAGFLKIWQVATDACRRGTLILSARVTSSAIQGRMHSGKSEASYPQVVEFRAQPGINSVALLALHRQIRGNVVGSSRLFVGVLMAGVALDR